VFDGVVSIDSAARTLVVKRSENASGYQKLSWRTAHEALIRAEQSGWRTGASFLWASGAGQTEIAFGMPSDNLALLFHFPPDRNRDVYANLVGQPGLRVL
jgi:hypothetical protein